MNTEGVKKKLETAYGNIQMLNIRATREVMTMLLSALINIDDAIRMLDEGGKTDDAETEGRDNV